MGFYYPRDRYRRSLVAKPAYPWLSRFLCRLTGGHSWRRHVWSYPPLPLYCTKCLLFWEENYVVGIDARGEP
jgi:hypothetical protein